MTYYIHCDLNKFYASIIHSFMPWINGAPVIVLSNNDGCSICQTKEAEAFGVKMGTAAFEIEDVIRINGIWVFSCNFPLIADMSLRVKSILRRYFEELEDYSIDEVFGQVSGLPLEQIQQRCAEVRRVILKGLGLPISIGISTTKTLAKVATRFAKKYSGYNGVCTISNERQRIKALQLTEIGDIWGIGRQHRKRLQAMGIRTAADWLSRVDHAWVGKHMTVVGLRTFRELEGVSCLELEQIAPPKKNIMVSRSFGCNITSFEEIAEALSTYQTMAAHKLRKQGSKARALYVFLSTNPFRDDLPQDFSQVSVKLPVASSSCIEIGQWARVALKALYRPGYTYKKAGIMMMDICDEQAVQTNLFDRRDRSREDRLMHTLDYLNSRYGANTVKLVAQGMGKRTWHIRQEKLPPYWSTRITDIPVAVDFPSSVAAPQYVSSVSAQTQAADGELWVVRRGADFKIEHRHVQKEYFHTANSVTLFAV